MSGAGIRQIRGTDMKKIKKTVGQILKVFHLYDFVDKYYNIVKYYWKKNIQTRKNQAQNRKIEAAVSKIIQKQSAGDYNGIVYIMQHSYYTRDGKSYISGGGERYASDIAEIIYGMGYKPILLQLGVPEDKTPWTQKRGNLFIIGINVDPIFYTEVIANLPAPKLAIYSGYLDFGNKMYKPNIMISHGITWDNPFTDVDTKLIKKMIDSVESLVSVDTNTISWLRSTYAKSLKEHPVDMQYVPNYVDLRIYRPIEKNGNGKIRIIFPRRCSPERGFWLVYKVLPQILDRYPNVEFDFVGFIHTPDIGDAIEDLKRRFPEQVHHYFVDAAEMYKVYQNADISLIPTLYSEGTSLSCIEAMACGNVVISTNIGGLPNLILDSYNGLLINPAETELLNALDKVLGNDAFRNDLRMHAVEVARVFSKAMWESRWKEFLNLKLNG